MLYEYSRRLTTRAASFALLKAIFNLLLLVFSSVFSGILVRTKVPGGFLSREGHSDSLLSSFIIFESLLFIIDKLLSNKDVNWLSFPCEFLDINNLSSSLSFFFSLFSSFSFSFRSSSSFNFLSFSSLLRLIRSNLGRSIM